MRALEKIFLKTIARESMFPDGSCITAAVSGGADSVAMLYLLNRFAVVRSWQIEVLHIDHGLRVDSRNDQLFVKNLAEQLKLPFCCRRPDSGASGSMESRWSSIRQNIFLERSGLVAVAHTASDRAETVLMRLFEGSGLRGLGGMDYAGVGSVRRPMLDMHSSEIRNWLKGKDISWIEDSSNQNTDIHRNRLRLEVMPVIEEKFPEAVRGICRSGALLSRWRDLQEQLSLFAEDNSVKRGELLDMPGVLGALALWNMAEKPRNGFEEFQKILKWLNSGGKGKHILPGGKRLVADEEYIRVEARGPGRF